MHRNLAVQQALADVAIDLRYALTDAADTLEAAITGHGGRDTDTVRARQTLTAVRDLLADLGAEVAGSRPEPATALCRIPD